MKFFPTVAAAALPFLLLATSAASAAAPTAATTPTAAATPAAAADDPAKMSYALGYQLGRDLASTDVRGDSLLKGIEDGRTGSPAKLSDAEMEASLNALQAHINTQRAKTQAAEAQKAAAAGTAYLAENAKHPGVTTTKSGLQYKVVTAGTGRTPGPSDSVTVHYRGTLVDGTEFDSSYKRGQPATFPVSGVIAGWTEALQLMKEGSKYQLVIPPALAYGDRGALANQVLLFDVELIKVEAGAPAGK
jgi:FKBP-type peptidyl-prolyl cis-trans isomerase FklB